MTRKELHSHELHIEIASTISKFSHANRRQVGALLVSNEGKIIGTGYNGTPHGVDNSCEDTDNVTFDYVIHAELNCILNSTTNDLSGSTIYITDSPCIKCAASILQKKIYRVIYNKKYRCSDGVEFLIENGVEVFEYSKLPRPTD